MAGANDFGIMNELLQNLLKLQSLEFDKVEGKTAAAMIAELRAKIPPQILSHYDRLAVRGKKGVAIVRDQVCTGCHMRLPIGVITTLMHGLDIQLCDNCDRYLYLAPPAKIEVVEPTASPKPQRKNRKQKKSPPAV
jgi:predicted  nucleic acid-binding Zn-ribbon protein